MSIRVGDLVSQLRERSRVVNVRMGDVALIAEGDDAGMLRVGDELLPWGARNTQMLAGFLKGPGYKYYEREPLEWQRTVIRHHILKISDLQATWYIEGTAIGGIYQPDAKVLPLVSVAEVVDNVFDPDDMANVLHAPDQVEINVVSKVKTVTVPGIPGDLSRPMEGTVDHPSGRKVGDLSAGGVRIIMQPGKPERAPIVEEFWERLVCTNGMVRRVSGSQINLRGRTVPEILVEMENVARAVFEGLDESALAIQHSAQTPVPGTVSDYLRVVARERGVNAANTLRLLERGAGLRANPTIYDVTQVITEMANEEGIPVLARRTLQALGGDLTIDTDRMVHRCAQCERPLVAA